MFSGALLSGACESGITYLTLVPIAGGVVIASGGEPLFHLLGFTACLLATSGRALKSVVQVGDRQSIANSKQEGWTELRLDGGRRRAEGYQQQ